MNKKIFLTLLTIILLISLASAALTYYDPTSNTTTNWDEGTAMGFEEIDDGTRQPTASDITDDVADSTQGADGISEFGFNTITETPNNMTLWVYTNTGSSCSFSFFLQQAGATRCTTTVTSSTANSWESCTWATPTGDYSAMTIELGSVTKGAGGHTECTVYDAYIEVDSPDNLVPNITNITASHTLIKGGDTITFWANSTGHDVNDSEGDTLNFYCDDSNTPTSSNTDCTGGTTTDTSDPYDLSCTFDTPTNSSNHTIFCRVYDQSGYSNVSNLTYETDATPPSTSITTIEGDAAASYFDTSDNDATEINISGEVNMICRWSSSDVVYSSMSNECTINASDASCSITDVASEGIHTRYISCQDSLTNEQNTSQNLNVDFFLDYTAPTTSDNSVTSIQVPNYTVTITESDNVDSDPTTLFCTDTINSCSPDTTIDDGGSITFTTANRGTNYLLYNSTDDAGNKNKI